MIIAEFGIVVWLSAAIEKMSASTATAGFIAYSVLNGVTFAVIFLAYTAALDRVDLFSSVPDRSPALSAFGGADEKKTFPGVRQLLPDRDCSVWSIATLVKHISPEFRWSVMSMAYIGGFSSLPG